MHLTRILIVLYTCLFTLSVSAEPLKGAAADDVFIGEHIITMNSPDERVSALAIKAGTIVWMGKATDAEGWIGEDTKVHKLGDYALLPGFIDSHGHLVNLGVSQTAANMAPPPVGTVTDIASLQRILSQYMVDNAKAKGEMIVGTGYDDSLLAEKRHPTRDDLDKISTDSPIILIHASGHLISANSAALALGGYDAKTPDPKGGVIRRRTGSTEPNGVLEEMAGYPLLKLVMKRNKSTPAHVALGLQRFASFGVTTVQDGRTSPSNLKLLRKMADAGQLNMDVVAFPAAMNTNYQLPKGAVWGEYNGQLKIGGVKMMLDGSPQGKTAFLESPYIVAPHGKDVEYRGYPILPQASVNKMVSTYLEQRVPIIAHANGDAAVGMLLNAFEAADPQYDHRGVVIHAQVVREEQLDQMQKLSMIPSFFSAHTFYWGDWHRDSVLGKDRAFRISPAQSAIQRGMIFTTHNDSPVVPPDMIRLLWATVNRQTRSGETLGKAQRISTYQALQSITSYGAYQYFEEDRKGTLSVGKQADLVVLSANPLNTQEKNLLSIKVNETWSHGKQVYSKYNDADKR